MNSNLRSTLVIAFNSATWKYPRGSSVGFCMKNAPSTLFAPPAILRICQTRIESQGNISRRMFQSRIKVYDVYL